MALKHPEKRRLMDIGIEEEFIAPISDMTPPTPTGTKDNNPRDTYNTSLVPDEGWNADKQLEGMSKPTATSLEGKEESGLGSVPAIKTHGYILKLLGQSAVQAKPSTIIRAATAYVAFGSFRRAAEDAKVKERTLRRWAEHDWWPEVIDYVGRVIDVKLEGDMTQLINKALLEIGDRLQNGDFIVYKGEVVGRKPLDAKDLGKLFQTGFDKRLLHRGAVNGSKNNNDGNQAAQLENVINRLEKLGDDMKHGSTITIIEGSDK